MSHSKPIRLDPPDTACFLVGVDGGGSGTRARLCAPGGRLLGQGSAGPSSLSQGVAQAWTHLQQAVAAAFEDAALPVPAPQRIRLSSGLAGAGVAAQRDAFLAADPGYAQCLLATDAAAQLAGAHRGQPGVVLAAGTGSVAAARLPDGRLLQVGGWGFPVGDEGGGAWLGLRAMQQAQAVADGRDPPGALAAAVAQAVGGADAATLLQWCADARQAAYGTLAPCVFGAAAAGDAAAIALLDVAVAELMRLLQVVDRAAAPALLQVVVVGSIGERLAPRWPPALRDRMVAPAGDSADGALWLLHAAMEPAVTSDA
ncbi:MAG: BadF/BadG/BcrA/BcrD ATPase family protein [Rubrivivax sp.]